jgi:CRISPR-associated protein Cas2
MVVTRNLPSRFEGFLAGHLLKAGPDVYIGPKMRSRVRERIWEILLDWSDAIPAEEGGIIMVWANAEAPSGLELRTLGWPQKKIVEYEGLWLVSETICAHHRFRPEDHDPDPSLRYEQPWTDPDPELPYDPQLTFEDWLANAPRP